MVNTTTQRGNLKTDFGDFCVNISSRTKTTEIDMRLEDLYSKYDTIVGAGGFNVTPVDHFVFDLTDENSQAGLKAAFPGIESLLMPEVGKYLVASTIVEQPNILVLMFPSQSDGSLGLCAFNTQTKKGKRLDNSCMEDEEQKTTIDNFGEDFANMEDIAKRFNEFAFMSDGEDSTEVKDIGSFEVSTDEPVEITNPNTDNEETKMAFKPINEDELKETKWVEMQTHLLMALSTQPPGTQVQVTRAQLMLALVTPRQPLLTVETLAQTPEPETQQLLMRVAKPNLRAMLELVTQPLLPQLKSTTPRRRCANFSRTTPTT